MDSMNPGIPGGTPPPPPPPMGGPVSLGGGPGDDPHDKIMEALKRIEDRLVVIAAKVGA